MVPAQQNYRPDIDGLRAVSIGLVLLFHGFGTAFPGGYIGVDVFFVISGYLITSQIHSQVLAGRFSFAGFYARRIRRIFPPLIAVLTCTGLYGYLRLNLADFSPLFKHIAAGTVFASNFVLWQEAGYFDKQSELKPLLHLWSLAIEEQFYVLWPILITALAAAARRYRSALGWGLVLVCLVSWGAAIHLSLHDSVAAFYSPLARFWELGLGGLLAVLQPGPAASAGHHRNPLAWDIAAVAACIGLVACALLLSSENRFPVLWNALPVVCATVIIAAGPNAAINRHLLGSAPMVQLGLISYALYLWHWPLLSFMRIESAGHVSATTTWLVLAASVVLAALTQVVVEKPTRRSPRRSMPVWLAAAFASIGVIGVLGYQTELLRPPRLLLQAQIQAQVKTAVREYDAAGIQSRDCADLLAPESVAYSGCRIWGPDNASHTVVVWGDSMSLAWMPPFFVMAREGWRVIQFSYAGCPPIVNVHRTGNSSVQTYCNSPALQTQVIDALRRIGPQTVFLIARWNLYYHGHIKNDVLVERTFITDRPGAANPASAARAFEQHLPATINVLSAFSRVVIFKDTPVLKVPVDIGLSTRPDSFEPSTGDMTRFEADINRVIDNAVARAPTAAALDPTTRLCNAITCSAYLDGLPAYVDEVHVTAHTALQFTPDIRSLGARR